MTLLDIATLKEKCAAVMQAQVERFLSATRSNCGELLYAGSTVFNWQQLLTQSVTALVW